jgi:hypothetical protein
MKRIVYTRPDGGLAIVRPFINTHPAPEPLTEEQALQRAISKLPPEVTVFVVVEETAIPADRTKREAWRLNGTLIEVDAVKWVVVYDKKAAKAIDGIDRLQFEHLFDLENRMRAREGLVAISSAQYRTALINRWKALNPAS